MSDDAEADDPGCAYAFAPSKDELDAFKWLFGALDLICERKRGNEGRAAVIRKALHRWANLQVTMHSRIHDLEDAVHALGGVVHTPPTPDPTPRGTN